MNFLGLSWRLPLYKRYFFYMRTCRNFASIIQYERRAKNYQRIEIRNGMEIYFSDISEAHNIFKEIWLERVYTKYYQAKNSTQVVVDIGANIGIFTLFAQYLWPDSATFAYEPSPYNYELLEKNIRSKRMENVYPFNVAVSNKVEVERFFLKDRSGANSFYQEINNNQEKVSSSVMVETVTIESVLERAGGHINFLKIDCEGAEWSILPSHEQALRQVSYVAMEYHIPPEKQLSDLTSIFERAGFDVVIQPPFKWGNWNLGFLYASNRCN